MKTSTTVIMSTVIGIGLLGTLVTLTRSLKLGVQLQAAAAPTSYTLYTEEYIGLYGGSQRLSDRITSALKTDGSTAQKHEYFDAAGKPLRSRVSIQAVGGLMIEANPDISAFTSMKIPSLDARRVGAALNPDAECIVQSNGTKQGTVVGREAVMGYDSFKVVTDDSTAAHMVEWRAPGLKCATIQRLAEFKNADGTIHDISKIVPVRVAMNDVDPALFVIPADYELLSPLDNARRRYKRQFGTDEMPSRFVDQEQQAEAAYAKFKFEPRQ